METVTNNMQFFHKTRGLGIGILLIVVGAVLLGINFGYISPAIKPVIFSWQSLIILVGIFHLRNRNQIVWGSIWILVGFFFLIPRIVKSFPDAFPGIGENFTSVYWPLLLIVAGFVIIVFRFILPKNDAFFAFNNKIHHHKRHGSGNSGFEKNSIFGGGEHIILEPEFKGGEANSIFGGMTIDLRRTSLPPGDTYLEVNAIFGGVSLYIPGDWNVVTQIDAVFGGFEDRRKVTEPVDNTRRLIIDGTCIFGGGEIVG